MAKHRRMWNQNIYEKYIKEGRGQGEGKDYKPWIRIQDFPSTGTVSRIYSDKTERTHHLLSNNEKYYFYLLEWSDKVLDIREQFPLSDIKLAMDISAAANIRYPIDKISGFPYVMTCDFMLTTSCGLRARTIKQVSQLSNPRVIEKLEIERRYWNKLGIDWKLVTDKDIDISKARAIEWIRQNNMSGLESIVDITKAKYYFEENAPLVAVKHLEHDFNLPSGMGMLVFKQLLQTKQFDFTHFPNIGVINVNSLCNAR